MKYDYKKLTPFKIQCLTNFPFIDEDFDALTNYELLCKIVEYMNNISTNNNLLVDNIDKLNNWFNNLDVQNEINEKLDNMANDGTLENIINMEIFGNINNEIDLINSKYTIMLGDSYAKGATDVEGEYITSWCEYLRQLMGLSTSECKIISSAGAGFIRKGTTSQTNFIEALQAEIINIPNLNAVRNIIVCGGYNDNSYDINDIKNAITVFNNYVNDNFPNAHLYIGCIGYDSTPSSDGVNINKNISTKVYPAYSNATNSIIRNKSYTYLNGVENILKSNYIGLMYPSNAHPNDSGYKEIAYGIYESINNGNFYPYTYYNLNMTPYQIGTLNSGTFRVFHAGGNVNIASTNIRLTYTEEESMSLSTNDFTPIINYNGNNFFAFSTNTAFNIFESTAIVEDYVSGKFIIPCQIYMNNGVMNARLLAYDNGSQVSFSKVKSIQINNINTSIPAVLY